MSAQLAKSERAVELNLVELNKGMRAKGIKSAVALAEALHEYPECSTLHPQTIRGWLKGKVRPDVAQAIALARHFGGDVVLDWFDWPGKEKP